MRYYHIIYNSSERSIEGGAGFGIRTATEGTPAELLTAIKSIKFFTDDWESYDNKPTPAQMKQEPSTIDRVAKNYAVTHIPDELGKVYYIIARRAYVGFDYGFYKNGMPTRPGNYVIDYYAFEEAPEKQAYEILYENALSGSNHFIPASVWPTVDNEEMKAISLGMPQALPVEEKSFAANVKDKLDKKVVILFFAYLRAKKNGKKLVVKVSKDESVLLSADLYRMMNAELARELRVFVNLRSQGINDNFDIFFILEDYPHQIYESLYDYIDLTTSGMPETQEAKAFANKIERYVTDSFERNRLDVEDIIRWLMLPEYDLVKLLSKSTNEAFFLYCIQQDNFSYDTLKDKTGKLNQEFLNVLCLYTKRNPKNAERFNLLVAETMNEANPDNVIQLVEEYNIFEKEGFAMETITSSVKYNVCRMLLSSANGFKKALDTFGYNSLSKFFVRDIFVENMDFTNTDVLDKYLLHLYKLFLTDDILGNKAETVWHFMRRDIDDDILYSLIDDVYKNDGESKLNMLIQVLKHQLKSFRVAWKHIQHYIPSVVKVPNFINEFENKITDTEYAPMFYYTLQKEKGVLKTIEQLNKLTCILAANSGLKTLVEKNYKEDGIYSEFYYEIFKKSDESPKEYLTIIKKNITNFLNIQDQRWYRLVAYLQMCLSDDTQHIESYQDIEVKTYYDLIVEHHNKHLFNSLLGRFILLAQKNIIQPKALADEYLRLNPKADVHSTLSSLAVPPTWIEMVGVIVKSTFNLPFKEALEIVESLHYSPNLSHQFLSVYYPKEYSSYQRKKSLSKFFAISNLKWIFVGVAAFLIMTVLLSIFFLGKSDERENYSSPETNNNIEVTVAPVDDENQLHEDMVYMKREDIWNIDSLKTNTYKDLCKLLNEGNIKEILKKEQWFTDSITNGFWSEITKDLQIFHEDSIWIDSAKAEVKRVSGKVDSINVQGLSSSLKMLLKKRESNPIKN